MATPFWLNAVLRSLVWLGATAVLAFLKKPDGASLAAVRTDFAGWLGVGLMATGLALHFWSNASLARGEYQARRGSDTLIAYGPYRFVRHPIYLAGISLLLGAGLLYSPLGKADLVGGLVLLVYFHLLVVRVEEPALRRRFGPRYEEYYRRVPRWLPRLGVSAGAAQHLYGLLLSRHRPSTGRFRARFPRRLSGQGSRRRSLRAGRHGVGSVSRVAAKSSGILAPARQHLLRVAPGTVGRRSQ